MARKPFLIPLIIFNTFIATVITTLMSRLNPSHFVGIFPIAFIFSQSIGFSVYLAFAFASSFLEKRAGVSRLLYIFLILLASGAVGTEIGYIINGFVFPGRLPSINNWDFLFSNLILAIIFGTAGLLYFSMKERLSLTVAALKEKEIEQERLKALRKAAELDALRNKIAPHFLFNTLNSIASLIRSDPARAESMIEKLSALFRYTLRSGDKTLVQLQEEIQVVRAYLEIESLRMGNRLRYQIQASPDALEVFIPPLLLQPLVENSVRHGLSPLKEGGEIHLQAEVSDGFLEIHLSDSGRGWASENAAEGFGIRSVRERLRLAYGKSGRFELKSEKGVQISIKVPLKTPENISAKKEEE